MQQQQTNNGLNRHIACENWTDYCVKQAYILFNSLSAEICSENAEYDPLIY